MNRLMAPADALGFKVSNTYRRVVNSILQLSNNSVAFDRRVYDALGGSNAWLDLYGIVIAGKAKVYGPKLQPASQQLPSL